MEKIIIATAIIALAALSALALPEMAHARFGDNQYQAGYHDGCGDHIKGNPYLGLQVLPTQQYITGYNNGWNACNG